MNFEISGKRDFGLFLIFSRTPSRKALRKAKNTYENHFLFCYLDCIVIRVYFIWRYVTRLK